VRDITLYHTTLVFGATNECCTVANGTLANLRVVNAARSPKAVLNVYLKFGTDVPWAKIQVFEKALRAFVQSRPREWLGVVGFLTTRVDSSLGFQEIGKPILSPRISIFLGPNTTTHLYALSICAVVILQHRESWQSVLALLVSKGEVTAYCHELQKKMDMRYKSPPLPVDLSVNQGAPLNTTTANARDPSSDETVVATFAGPLATGQNVAHRQVVSESDYDSVAKLFNQDGDS
jgi:hypothetical protein